MKPRHYFPLGKAYGQAFCNRVEETKRLLGNVENGKHTFLVAPRRYGKSSLCERVFERTSLPWGKLDFHLAVSTRDVERLIINGVIELVGKAVGSVEKMSTILKKYTKQLKPKLSVGTKNFRLELEVSSESSPAENIAEALLLLDKLLQEKKKQAILLFDEFQEVGQVNEGRSMEGAIRHVCQETRQLSCVFSGSNPHVLNGMFEDERRPLYKLCRKLILGRISGEHYRTHLNKAARAMWQQNLGIDVFERIIELSARHPYYVNYLCDILWSEHEKLPTVKNVDKSWGEVVEEERSDLLKDFFRLTDNQRRLLMYFAGQDGGNVYANEVMKKIGIPVSSISRALNSLLEGDYIEKGKNGYRLIVPVYRDLLRGVS